MSPTIKKVYCLMVYASIEPWGPGVRTLANEKTKQTFVIHLGDDDHKNAMCDFLAEYLR